MAILWKLTTPALPGFDAAAGTIETDVAVVGGGYTGMSAALHLAEAGIDVCLFEAEAIGHGGSGRNVGLVNAGLWLPPGDVEAHLGKAAGQRLNNALAGAPDLVFDLIDRHRIDCEAQRRGSLHCAHAPRGMADLEHRHRQLRERGAPVELLPAGAARDRIGSPAVHGALFDPRAGNIQPLAYLHGLAGAAVAAGARIFEHSPVQNYTRQGHDWLLTTPGARIRAKRIIIATNAYDTSNQSKGRFCTVHFMQAATVPLSNDQIAGILPDGIAGWDTAKVMSSFRRDQAGRVIIGGIGNTDTPSGAVHRTWAQRRLRRLFPQLAGVALQEVWSGQIAMTRDHLPHVERLGPDALSIFGYSGRGIGPGTLFGRAAANWATGDQDAFPVPVRPTQPDRFAGFREWLLETGARGVHLLSDRP